MGLIGSFAGIEFQVLESKIETINNLSIKDSARWATHDMINVKPRSEFLGAGLKEISFTMNLSAFQGIKPFEEQKKLVEFCHSGKIGNFILGNENIGKFYIKEINSNPSFLDNKGNIFKNSLEIFLIEYAEEKIFSTKTKSNTDKKDKSLDYETGVVS